MDIEELIDYYYDNYNQAIVDWSRGIDRSLFINSQIWMGIHKEDISDEIPDNFPKSLKKFLTAINEWKIKWELTNTKVNGAVNILSLKDILLGDVDFKPDEFPKMKNFTLLDHFYNESAVGFYLDKPENGLYYFEFDADPIPMNLDFAGYLEMIKYTKGVAYWQKSILEPVNRNSSHMIEEMHKLSPEITVEGFFKLYDSLKMNTNT